MTIQYVNKYFLDGQPKERGRETIMLPGRLLLLEHLGSSIQVSVDQKDQVRVFLKSFKGNPENFWLSGYTQEETRRLFEPGSRTTEIKIQPKDGEDVLSFLAGTNSEGKDLVVEKLGPSMRERSRG